MLSRMHDKIMRIIDLLKKGYYSEETIDKVLEMLEHNPDLPVNFIRDTLSSQSELESGNYSEFNFE